MVQWMSSPASAGDTGWTPGPEGSHMLWDNEARAPQLLQHTGPVLGARGAAAARNPRAGAQSSPHSMQLEAPQQ